MLVLSQSLLLIVIDARENHYICIYRYIVEGIFVSRLYLIVSLVYSVYIYIVPFLLRIRVSDCSSV